MYTVGERQINIDAFRSDICPRAIVKREPELMELVQIYARSTTLAGKGVAPMEDVPAKLADAFVVMANEEAVVSAAISDYFKQEHEMEERRRARKR
jgi:tmRNA-binding protein